MSIAKLDAKPTGQVGTMTGADIELAVNSAITAIELSPQVSVQSGLTLAVSALNVSGFTAEAATLTLIPNGKWYVGVDMFSREFIALPRLGHTGWMPLAYCETDATTITGLSCIDPVLPVCKIPRVVKKIINGENIKAVIIGSSLSASTADTSWGGMLFNATTLQTDYKVTGANLTYVNAGLGGAPNMYGLAQTGIVNSHRSSDYKDAGWPLSLEADLTYGGRSDLFKGVDLAVITVLANGGNYRLECVEPTIRNLRKMGVEIIIVSDNGQGAPFTTYDSGSTAGLYVDGDYVRDLAELYGIEYADTAAYVLEAELRYPATIYSDSIHMGQAAPNGRTGQPSCGNEVWARAIRSTIPTLPEELLHASFSNTFDTDVEGYYVYGSANNVSVSWENSAVRVEKTTADNQQWGCQVDIANLVTGDTVEVSYILSGLGGYTQQASIGLQGGGVGWASNSVAAGQTAGTVTLVASRDNNDARVLFFGSHDAAPLGAAFSIDNVTVNIPSSASQLSAPSRNAIKYVSTPLPKANITTDFKKAGDAFVILPKDEFFARTSSVLSGTLINSPRGANSFARQFSSLTDVNEDLLTVETGQRVAIAANGVVSFAMILYSENGNAETVYEVYKNNALQKTVTIAAQTLSREIYHAVYTNTDTAKSDGAANNETISIRVTSGKLQVAALVAQTSEITYIPPEEISFIGTWGDRVTGGSPSMSGYATDTINDYAAYRCPVDAHTVHWVVSSKSVSKPVDITSGSELVAGQATSGTNHIKTIGGLEGGGESHSVKLMETLIGGGDTAGGWGLHVGGILLVHDR